MKIRKRRLADTVRRIEAATQDQNCEALKIEDARPDPEHQCIANDLAAKALRSLSPSLRDTFLLCKAEGWTHQELAGVMGISIGTIVCVRAKPWLTTRVEVSGFVKPRRSG